MQEKVRKALNPPLYQSVGDVITSLPERYFEAHDEEEIALHAETIAELRDDYPVGVTARRYERDYGRLY